MIREPLYASEFECLAGKCPDSCCKEWEIVIDPETEKKYLEMTGETGEELRACMEKDEDGDTIFHNVDGHCPWWNSDGLCRLRILKGQEMTSLICRLHPLIIEEYESFTEGMLSISCPEAYRLILSSPVSSYPEITEKAEDEVLNLLAECRNTWLKEMDEEKSAEENLRLLYTLGAKYQKEINDAEGIEEPLLKYEDLLHGTQLCNELLPFARTDLEITTDRFRNLLSHCTRKAEEKDLKEALSNRILAYFACRYELKAVNDCDLMHHIQFIELSLYLPAVIAALAKEESGEVYRLYSREVEHNADNYALLYDKLVSLE